MGVTWDRWERGNRAIRVFAMPVSVVAVTGLVQLVMGSSALAASEVTQTFKPAAQTQIWTVPAGVTELEITVRGGAGASGFAGGSKAGAGGSGAQVTGLLGVSPGQTLSMDVGSAGGPPLPRTARVGGMAETTSRGGEGRAPTALVASAAVAGTGISAVAVVAAAVAPTPSSARTTDLWS
jgi:hypothetical protein